MESEVKPLNAAAVEVSAPAPKLSISKLKKIALKDRTPEQAEAVRVYEQSSQKKTAQKKREAKKVSSFVYDSPTEPTKTEAKEILTARGIKHVHVQDVVYKALLRAASENNITPNRFLFANGIVQTLASYAAQAPQTLEPIAAEYVETELLNRAELHALFDACYATANPEVSFPTYLEIRLRCKQDCWYLGKEILDKDLSDCHAAWRDFFPKFSPTLKPNFTQKQAIAWLNEQSLEIKTFLLLASRSAFKSSFSHIWILSLILCQPSIRILLVSETKPLAKSFIEVIRSFFEMTPGQESKFHRLFPEFTIPVGDGSTLSLEVPMRHLKLAQSITSTSMDSAVAGNRADVILYDDCISSTSCGNEVQIQASINKFLALGKLAEVGGSLKILLGTPWAPSDLYSYVIGMSEAEDSGIAYRIDPAFVVKASARYKLTPALLQSLTQDDIESYLFPERLNWRFLRREIGSTVESAAFFLSQNLCLFPSEKDADLRCTFEMEDLERHTRGAGFFETPTYVKFLSLDRAWSISKYADFSCLTVGTIQVVQDKRAMVIRDVKMERLKESELVKAVCDMIAKHRDITYAVAERDRGYEDLAMSIQLQLQMRGIPSPHWVWKPIPSGAQNDKMKVKRAKKLENPIHSGRLWWVTAEWNEVCHKQLCNFTGLLKSNSTRKDDYVDTVSLAWENLGPREELDEKPPELTAEEKMEAEIERKAAAARAWHENMYGMGGGTRLHPGAPSPQGTTAKDHIQRVDWTGKRPEPQQPTEPPRQLTPREQAQQQLMKVLPSAMRRRNF